MRIYRFRKEEHPEHGSEGWLLIGGPSTYYPLSGMGIAHDIMEHRWGDKGTIEEELMALGAMLYIRGEGGYWAKTYNPNPGYALSGDYSDLFIQFNGMDGIENPGRTVRASNEVEYWIDTSFKHGRTHVLESFDDPTLMQTPLDDFFSRARGWLRKGYRAAQKRYRGIPYWRLVDCFEQIQERADELLRNAESFEQLHVRFEQKTAEVKIYLS